MRTATFLVRGLLDRALLVTAIVAGGLVPGFIAQYRQRLGGRLDQARIDLAAWQKLADQFFQGDLNRLIQYHLDSNNPTFHSEGALIRSLVALVQQLQDAAGALHGDLIQQVDYLALHLDVGLARATLADWVPTFSLSVEGIIFALAFGLVVWLLFHLAWRLVALLGTASIPSKGRQHRDEHA